MIIIPYKQERGNQKNRIRKKAQALCPPTASTSPAPAELEEELVSQLQTGEKQMKRTITLLALAIFVLASCAPAASPVSVSPDAVEPIYFSLIGRTDKAYDNEAYYSQRLVTGTFADIGLDCSASLLKADQKLVHLNSIEWLAMRDDVQDVIDPPGTNSYTTFVIPGDGRDPNFGFTLPDPRLNAIEVINSSISAGPCGFIVAEGWLYEDIDDLDLEYDVAKARHAKASLEGKFLINPAYIQNGLVTPSTTYSGKNWPTTSKVDKNLLIFDGGNPGSITCNGTTLPAWYFVNKLHESWDVDLDDSQISGEFIHRRSVGDTIPMWGAIYPPEFNAVILGTGWTYDEGRYHAYIILGLPEGCVQ